MKTLDLNQMENTRGGCDEREMLNDMIWAGGWGALVGGPFGALVGAWGAAAKCIITSPKW